MNEHTKGYRKQIHIFVADINVKFMWLLKTTIEGCGEFIEITFIILKPLEDNPVLDQLYRNGRVIICYCILVFSRNAIKRLLSLPNSSAIDSVFIHFNCMVELIDGNRIEQT